MTTDASTDLIGEWCDYHHNLHNISRQRRTEQLRVLRALEAMLPGAPELINARDLERYQAKMIHDGYHPHTVVRHLRMIRPFVRWLWQHQMIDAERWLRLQAVRGPRGAYDGMPRPYTKQEIHRFWLDLDARYPWTRDSDPHKRTPARGEFWLRRWAQGQSAYRRVYPYARRMQIEAIVALALYAGLRRGEIYNISISDMHYENEYVRVVGARKGPDAYEKVRVVAMSRPLMLAVGNWIEFREQVLAPEHDFPWLCLWSGAGGCNAKVTNRMTYTQYQLLLRRMGRGWEFHRLRHTYATERYRAGMPLEILQHTLGHSTVAQTQGYAQINEDRIIAASKASDAGFFDAVHDPTQTSR